MNKIELLTLFFLFISSSAFAALTEVQHKSNSYYNAGSPISTLSTTVTATGSGNLLVVGVINDFQHTVSSVSDGTNNFIQYPNAVQLDLRQPALVDVWYLPESTSGKTSITANISGPSVFMSLEVWEVTGFKNPVPDVAGGLNNGVTSSSTDIGAAVNTSSNTEFIIGIDEIAGAVTANPKAGNAFTSGGNIDSAGSNGFCSLITSAIGSYQPEWSDTNGDEYATTTAAFRNSVIYINNAKINKAKFGF